MLNFMAIRPVGAQFFHEGGRTDGRTWRKLIVVFRNFANAPKNYWRLGLPRRLT